MGEFKTKVGEAGGPGTHRKTHNSVHAFISADAFGVCLLYLNSMTDPSIIITPLEYTQLHDVRNCNSFLAESTPCNKEHSTDQTSNKMFVKWIKSSPKIGLPRCQRAICLFAWLRAFSFFEKCK